MGNPVAAEIGAKQESEYERACRLVQQLCGGCLLLADRLYGVQSFVVRLLGCWQQVGSEFWVRVRSNLQRRVVQVLEDGSALVEIVGFKEHRQEVKLTVREIGGRVRGGDGKLTEVRLWTSLLDAKKYPAAVYAQRWGVESTIKELKVEARGGQLTVAQTPETAAQELRRCCWCCGYWRRGGATRRTERRRKWCG